MRPFWAQAVGGPVARAFYLAPLLVVRVVVLWLWEQVGCRALI